MRKIDELVQDAWVGNYDFKLGNTQIEYGVLLLHGNVIARKTGNKNLFISLAGWNTQTTRSRINAILPYGFVIKCKKGKPYLNDVELDCTKWYTIHYSEVLEVAEECE